MAVVLEQSVHPAHELTVQGERRLVDRPAGLQLGVVACLHLQARLGESLTRAAGGHSVGRYVAWAATCPVVCAAADAGCLWRSRKRALSAAMQQL